MATYLRNRKKGPDRLHSRKYLSFGEKMVKIGPVDPENNCSQIKKKIKKLQVGKFTERAGGQT